MKYISFDTETTGVMPGARLIEIAAVLFDENGAIDTFKSLVNPGMPIPPDATSVNAITNDMVKDAPNAGQVLNDLFNWLPGKILVAHYACFDTGIISWEAGRFGIDIPEGLMVIDTCDIAKVFKETKNNKLATLADHHKLERQGDDHRALADAHLCRQLFQLYKKRNIPDSPLPWAQAGHNYEYTDQFPDMLKDYPEKVAKAEPVTFDYTDAKDQKTTRTLIPNGWCLQNGNLMVNGWCQLREATRTFRADRIDAVVQKT